MKMIKRIQILLIGILGFSAIGYAQRQDTIFQTLATNYVGTQNSILFGPVTNIGQGFHKATLVVTNQTGKTCYLGSTVQSSSTQIQFVPQGSAVQGGIPSYNETLWFANDGIVTATAVSPAPFIYINVTGFDFANCQLSLTYFGSLYPGAPDVLTYSNAITSGYAVPALKQIRQSLSTSGATTLLGALQGYAAQNIYEMVVSNTTSGQTLTFNCGFFYMYQMNNLQAGQIVVLPFTNSAYMSCPNGSINVTLSAATQTDIQFEYKVE